jgi:hypothetical protein
MHGAMFEIASGFVFIHPREHIGAARHADGGGIVMIVENHPVRRELVYVGRFHIFISITSHRVGRLIVGKEENEVPPFVGRKAGSSNKKESAGQ